jgi:hypothetical protein
MQGRYSRLAALFLFLTPGLAPAQQPLKIATFQVDVTPPLGSQLCDGLVMRAREIVDPLSARGIIFLTDQKPVVVCAFDWVGIGNEGHDEFCKALAQGAGTSPERVAIHCLHQHDAPGCDFAAEKLLAKVGLSGAEFDPKFARLVMEKLAAAAKAALKKARPVTHVGLGIGDVKKVASNRRILGDDGKVKLIRFSSCKIKEAIDAPEGVIDPKLRLLSFWDGPAPLVSITFYATHPQSYYGHGGVSADFVGLARKLREADLPDLAHVHFNGAGGNIAAGKYNDGAPGNRPILAQRLAKGMKLAWEKQVKQAITAADVRWSFQSVGLPPRDFLKAEGLLARLHDEKLAPKDRVRAARDLAFLQRMQSGQKTNINCLRLGSDGKVLFMPGELFIEYQLAAQAIRPKDFVAMAAYGDYGPGYIGTKIAYAQGGYETGLVSRVAPSVEQMLMKAMQELLKTGDSQ